MKKFLSITFIIFLSVIISLKLFNNPKSNANFAMAEQNGNEQNENKENENQKDFLSSFYTCSKYLDNGNSRIIIIYGFANRQCYYEEVSFNKSVKCHFSVSELHNIAKEMKATGYESSQGIETLSSVQKLGPEACKIKRGGAFYQG